MTASVVLLSRPFAILDFFAEEGLVDSYDKLGLTT